MECWASNCGNISEYCCDCREMFCLSHHAVHKKNNPTHQLVPSRVFLPPGQVDLLPQVQRSMKLSYLNSVAELTARRKKDLQDLYEEIRQIHRKHQADLQELNRRFGEAYNLLASITVQRYFFRLPTSQVAQEFAWFCDQAPQGLRVRDIKWFFQQFVFSPAVLSPSYSLACVFDNVEENFSIQNNDGPVFTAAYEQFNGSSRVLCLSSNQVIATGGTFQMQATAQFDLGLQSVKPLGPLNWGRKWHAMALVNYKPAVIGGASEDGSALRTVEILEDQTWVPWHKLKKPRMCCTATWYFDRTYVVGGITKVKRLKTYLLDSVEVTEASKWKLLKLKLPTPLYNVGVLSRSPTDFWLVGGCDGSRHQTAVYSIEQGTLVSKQRLKQPRMYPHNQWLVTGDEAFNGDNKETLDLSQLR